MVPVSQIPWCPLAAIGGTELRVNEPSYSQMPWCPLVAIGGTELRVNGPS